jgi:hypothetical protein
MIALVLLVWPSQIQDMTAQNQDFILITLQWPLNGHKMMQKHLDTNVMRYHAHNDVLSTRIRQ